MAHIGCLNTLSYKGKGKFASSNVIGPLTLFDWPKKLSYVDTCIQFSSVSLCCGDGLCVCVSVCWLVQCTYVCGLVQCICVCVCVFVYGLVQCMYNIVRMYVG